MSLSFSQLPHELYEEILSCLSLTDAFSLLLTCTDLYFSRALWFSMLERASKSIPLPGPFNLDIAAMDLAELRKVARKARVLQLNMTREQPQYQSRAKFDLKKGTDQVIITVVPGTQIVLTQAWKASTISCWDLSAKAAVLIGTLENVRLAICSSPYIANNEFILAIISKSHSERTRSRASVVVISVDYSDRSNLSFTETFRRQVSLLDPRLHPAMRSPTQGILVGIDPNDGRPLVATFDTASQQDPGELINLKPIPFQISRAIDFIHVYTSQGHYYMVMELRNRKVEMIHFPFPVSTVPPESIIRLDSIDGAFGYTTLCNANVAGIKAVSRRSQFLNDISDDGQGRLADPVQQELTLTFWLTGTSHYSFTFNLNTSRFHSQVIWQSGPSLLLLLYKPIAEDTYGQEHSLELFRFQDFPVPSCTRHHLTVPPDVDLDSLALDGVAGRFEWDDHLGIAYTILKGVITTIAYA